MKLNAGQIEQMVNTVLPEEFGGMAMHWCVCIDAVASDGKQRFFGLLVSQETPNYIAKGMLMEGIDELRNDPDVQRRYE